MVKNLCIFYVVVLFIIVPVSQLTLKMMVKPILGLSTSIANLVMAGDIDKPEQKGGVDGGLTTTQTRCIDAVVSRRELV